MIRLKQASVVILVCFLLLIGSVLMTIVWTKVQAYLPASHSFTDKSLVSTHLFGDRNTEHFVLDCITRDVVGVRPNNVATVDIRQLRSSEHSKLDQRRKAAFSEIFRKRSWGQNAKVDFSASGKPPALLMPLSCHYSWIKCIS